MSSVAISPKFQIVIPKSIRDELGLTVGERLEAIALNGHIELIPIRPVRELRGFLEGIDTTVEREGDRA